MKGWGGWNESQSVDSDRKKYILHLDVHALCVP